MAKRYKYTIVCFVTTLIFSLLACVFDRQTIGPNNTAVGFADLNDSFRAVISYSKLMVMMSDIMMYIAFAIAAFFTLLFVFSLVSRSFDDSNKKMLMCLVILYVIVGALYVFFKKVPINYRPIIMPGQKDVEPSFPSTHTLVLGTVMSTAILTTKRFISNEYLYNIIKYLFILIMFIGIAARFKSGVHWFTDIVAGIMISITLFSLYKNTISQG